MAWTGRVAVQTGLYFRKWFRRASFRTVGRLIFDQRARQDIDRAMLPPTARESGAIQTIESSFRRPPGLRELDLYFQGRLEKEETIALDEHLLICEHCRSKLDWVASFTRAIRENRCAAGWS